MTKTKLNIRFHNPNTVEETAGYLTKILFEVNKKKLEQVMVNGIYEFEDEHDCLHRPTF